MNRDKEIVETWNKIASLYQEKFMDLDIYNESYDFICNSIIKNKAKILEIGCGPGNITKYLLSKRPDFDIFGIDIAPNMIKLAKINNPNASFAVMDTRKISELKSKFDGIICGLCLPYISQAETEKLIFEVGNLLNEHGFLYLSFVEGDSNKSGYNYSSSGIKSYFYYHELDFIKSQILGNSFGEIKVFKVDYKISETEIDIHTIVTARKKVVALPDIKD